MKRAPRIVLIALLLVSILCMFLPVATFEDDTASSMQADIDKQTSRVSDAQAKLDRYINGGKSEDDIAKQRTQVEKQQAKLDELLEQQAALSGDSASGLKYSLLPGGFPTELKLDEQLINNNKVYPLDGNISSYNVIVWIIFALLVLTLAFVILGGDKLVSKFFTFASFTNLAAIVLIVFTLLRLNAFPIALPYSDAVLNIPVVVLLIALPIVCLGINCTCMRNTKRTMIYVFCITLSALAILPFWIMIVNATRSSAQIQDGISLIPGNRLSNNWYILTSKNFDISIGFKNSAIIAFGSTILGVFFSALTAYGFTVYNFKGKKFLWAVVMAIIMIPGQVTGTGFYMFMYKLGLTNNYLPLIIPAIASASTVFFFRQYLAANFQVSLVEASRIDGAGEFYSCVRIVMPIMIPAMATMGIMAVIASWNNYLTPLMLLSDNNMKTLPMMVKELRGDIYRTEYGSIYLGMTLTALPLMIVYFAFSKYIIAGVAVGGVK